MSSFDSRYFDFITIEVHNICDGRLFNTKIHFSRHDDKKKKSKKK